MRLRLFLLFLFVFLFLPSCENGVVIAFNPDEIDYATFIKTEKVNPTGEMNCDYGDASHEHSQGDSYYLYFTLTSAEETVITPSNSTFSHIKDQLAIELQKRNASENFVKDTDIQVGDIEFISLNKDLDKRQNFNFLIDLSDKKDCTPDLSKDECSLSGGLTQSKLSDLLDKIKSSLQDLRINFEKEETSFQEDEFMGVKFMSFSLKNNDSSDDFWFRKMTSTYITEMYTCDNNPKMSAQQQKNINCWLASSDENAYRGLKSRYSKYHRKLFDAYSEAAKSIKADSYTNKNLVIFTGGYEEGYYDTESALSASNQSEATEDDFFNALTKENQTPVFIAPQDRSQTASFPENSGVAPDGTDIDNKFYKLACLTEGAYMPFINETNNWQKTKPAHYAQVMKKIKLASYGMYRVKITLNNTNTDRFYDGGFIIKTKTRKGEEKETGLTEFRLVR